ncbi:MAG: hypothetical protein KJ826_16515 [Proteobacteria bacterium]|nr:hypothetical protein [Pseudomonadota bacterium]MBU4034855.1 hypothetical protein [Pseudomonadota bacterium]
MKVNHQFILVKSKLVPKKVYICPWCVEAKPLLFLNTKQRIPNDHWVEKAYKIIAMERI